MNSVCERLGILPKQPETGSKLGLAIQTVGVMPINGLRHKPENGTNGWYIWCGQNYENSEDYFTTIHFGHIERYLPKVIDYLNLPPGYRFILTDEGYEDVWFDKQLLKT